MNNELTSRDYVSLFSERYESALASLSALDESMNLMIEHVDRDDEALEEFEIYRYKLMFAHTLVTIFELFFKEGHYEHLGKQD